MSRFRVMHYNVNGLLGKKPLFDQLLKKYSPDIVAVNEVKTKRKLKFKNYEVRNNIRKHKKGGGVLMLVKKGIEFEDVNPSIFENGNETVSVNLLLEDKTKILFSAIYCPPDKQLNKRLIKDLVRINKNCIITGDLNAHRKETGSTKTDIRGRQLTEVINAHHLTMKNAGMQTYENFTTGKTDHLDVVLGTQSIENKVGKIFIGDKIGSDHFPILFDVNLKPMKITRTLPARFQFQKANWEKYKSELTKKAANYTGLTNTTSKAELENEVKTFTRNIISEAERNIPKRKERTETSKPYPIDVINLIKEKSKVRREYQNTKDRDKKRELNRIEKKIKKRTKQLKKEAYDKEVHNIATSNPSTSRFWKEIRRMKNEDDSAQTPPVKLNLEDKNEVKAVTEKEKCNKFAEYLESLFKTPNNKKFDRPFKIKVEKKVKELMTEMKTHPSHSGVLTGYITMKEFKQSLKRAKKKSSKGSDDIQSEFINQLPKESMVTLLSIFNHIVRTGDYPDAWKDGIITMIPKKSKDKASVRNYRPICVTSQLGKLLERIITDRLVKFCEDNNVFHRNQVGYRKNKSTIDQLTKLVSDVEKGFYKDKKVPKMTATLLIDLEKAFDSVWHDGLIYKMHQVGLSIYDLRLVNSYLRNRTFRVKVGNSLSEVKHMRAGVPQGGILSPILFLIYTGDLPTEPLDRNNVKDSHYADDIIAWAISEIPITLTLKLQVAAIHYAKWANKWRLSLNPTKCSVLVFKKKPQKVDFVVPYIPVKINGVGIENKVEETSLGLILNNRLQWSLQTDKVITSGIKTLGLLRSLRWNDKISKATTLICYRSLVLSKIIYGQPAWLRMNKTLKDKLQVLQNDFLRAAEKKTRLDHCRIEDLHTSNNFPTISESITEATTSFFERKLNDPSFQEVMENVNDPDLYRIGWHKMVKSLISE